MTICCVVVHLISRGRGTCAVVCVVRKTDGDGKMMGDGGRERGGACSDGSVLTSTTRTSRNRSRSSGTPAGPLAIIVCGKERK